MMHVFAETLVLDDGTKIGPFSSHWAACAAMICMSDPQFQSLGGDKPPDLEIERRANMSAAITAD